MKKAGIITLNGNYNFGNKLQNYALLNYLKQNFDIEVYTIWTDDLQENKTKLFLKKLFRRKGYLRQKKFCDFNKYLNVKKYKIDRLKDYYDYYIIGSDQVWNYNDPIFNSNKYFALFAPKNKVVSYSASFGVTEIEDDKIGIFKEGLNNLKYISVREEKGKELAEKITKRDDIEVLIDPTMLISKNEWKFLSKKPKNMKNKKYILNYFLGKFSLSRKAEIERIAKNNNCDVINILDKNDPYYISGPCEFLWLVENAFLICTDSFHACVFSLIFDKSFIVYDRDDKLKNMSSRIDTLLKKFMLKNRKYNGKMITPENLSHDYNDAFRIINDEKKRSHDYLENFFNKTK